MGEAGIKSCKDSVYFIDYPFMFYKKCIFLMFFVKKRGVLWNNEVLHKESSNSPKESLLVIVESNFVFFSSVLRENSSAKLH